MTLIFILFLSLAVVDSSANDRETVTGYLQLFGSEPFPQLAVVTRDNQRIFLDLTPGQYEKIDKRKKEFIKIKGNIIQKEFLGQLHPFITPDCWKWIDKPDDW
jgi:hypothetical protein